ncbi:hypothetical protein GLAREA_07308 [Glarea lozoyensis ATCC 20868]|uniref:Uncharacterized protein n=1 Tax=Glarea lozoyensis (strain ATCC 20868 / MF5171) TaxID=1116229 RepID=S3D2Y5_GLAL2|nr:uncharacterized protein GLAREA_07308 [Glarea lozoyensis ATCC 20868]EPE32175.1 hypothetical protein GLAREA_07308 [Glarea lozoyensis ATCC 20868]
MSDMKLLHFWLTEGATNFTNFGGGLNNIFSDALIKHSFEHEFLMHELLSFSALHLSRLKPQDAQDYLYISDAHHSKGLTLFQLAVSRLDDSNREPCYLFSSLIFIHAWAAQDVDKPSNLFFIPSQHSGDSEEVLKWVQLHRGSKAILTSNFSQIRNGGLRPMFEQWEDLGREKEDQLEEEDERSFDSFHEALTSSLIPETQKAVLIEALNQLRRIFCFMSSHHYISKLSAVMSWFMTISDEYLLMLENKMPEALVIVAFYAVAIKRLPYMWWLEGKSENVLQTVLDELGGSWESHTRWAVEQIRGYTDAVIREELPRWSRK